MDKRTNQDPQSLWDLENDDNDIQNEDWELENRREQYNQQEQQNYDSNIYMP